MSTTALMNVKGGTGKTTTVINLAAQASMNKPTLMVDCDPQGNVTKQFLEQIEGHGGQYGTVRDLFFGRTATPIEVRKNLFLIPSGDLISVDLDIQNKLHREYILKKSLSKIVGDFDYVFIDCPPARNLITLNALCASDYVIIPIEAEYFSVDGAEDMIEYVTEIINEQANEDLVLLGILVTKYDDRLNIGKWIMDEFKERGWDDALFKTMIRDNTDVSGSQFKKKTIFEYNRRSHAANDYAKLGQEVLNKIKKLEKQTV
ncbi:MAG: ParA family protein [Bacteroidota bacterium]